MPNSDDPITSDSTPQPFREELNLIAWQGRTVRTIAPPPDLPCIRTSICASWENFTFCWSITVKFHRSFGIWSVPYCPEFNRFCMAIVHPMNSFGCLCGTSHQLWNDDFDHFLATRTQALLGLLSQAMGKLPPTSVPIESPASPLRTLAWARS